MTNKAKILKALQEMPFITQMFASRELDMNGTTFTKAISDLIKDGENIQKMMTSTTNSRGEVKRFKMYWLGDSNG